MKSDWSGLSCPSWLIMGNMNRVMETRHGIYRLSIGFVGTSSLHCERCETCLFFFVFFSASHVEEG